MPQYCSFFRLKFAAGAALALATGTACQIEESQEWRFMLRYVPSYGSSGGPYWEVMTLEANSSITLPVA